MIKTFKWSLDDEIKTRDDLLNLVWAAIDDMKEPITDEDFEYLLYMCKDVLRIAKKKRWAK